MTSEFLLCEKYRPQVIDDCILPDDIKKTFKEFVERGEIPNLLLSGPPGIGKTTIAKALPLTESPILGLLKTPVANGSDGIAVVAGVMENINTSGFENGDVLYVGTSGGLTNVRPTGGSGAVGVVAHASNTGVIIVEAKGNGTWGALKDGLS